MASLWDYISPTGKGSQDRSNWLRENVDQPISEAARYYLGAGTGVPNLLGLLADGTPSSGLGRASQASQQLFSPDQSILNRVNSVGNLLSETAGVGAGLLGVNQTARAVGPAVEDATRAFGRNVAERLNQRGPMPTLGSNGGNMFDVVRKDASEIFGQGSERVRYTDPKTGATTEVVVRPDGSASVLDLEVPEASRGKGIGQNMQERIMQDYPMMGGQVSSKAAAKTAYRLGRRPVGKPDATLDDVFAEIDDMSSVNMVSPAMQERFAKKLPAARTEAEAMAKQILELRSAGRANEVTEAMMAAADNPYMYANTPLDMSQEARMARADEMFPREGFHGTNADIDAFQGNVFSTDNPTLASTYARGIMDAQIYPLRLGSKLGDAVVEGKGANWNQLNISDVKDPEVASWLDWAEGQKVSTREIEQAASREGRSGVQFKDINDMGAGFNSNQFKNLGYTKEQELAFKQQYMEDLSKPSNVDVRLSPNLVRSKFARFDPEFRNLTNLTAAIPVGLLGLNEYKDRK
jgi:hypothetical protein